MLRIALVLALVAGAALAQIQRPPYRIQPGDSLSIAVLEDPSLNATVLVRPDGVIAVPLVGSVDVAGRTPEEVRDILRRGLTDDFVAPPTVTVSLTGVGAPPVSSVVYVLGEVGSPGRYELDQPIDMLQLLAIVGGPGPFAATRRIQVRRSEAGAQTLLLFDYENVEDGELPVTPIILRDGDVVIVPERGLFE